ncbi:uncharacterized protein LOC129763378 [Toxorhynchites rutilus septentrionalis]|uniref:uncharacterized protein LOC129763378 n=1 Tax=Toxorhynchites rutilus septentrionalis TaxID=329112 RepID=UPI0024799A81|nr:uncharacterized protein LOC129763378 [Toxorhynchites rutilus septentrionalis]
MNDCELGIFELLTFDLEDFRRILEPCGIDWSYKNLSERISAWRKRNKQQIAALLNSDAVRKTLHSNAAPVADQLDTSAEELLEQDPVLVKTEVEASNPEECVEQVTLELPAVIDWEVSSKNSPTEKAVLLNELY